MKYNRILLKLSGESLMGDDGYGIQYPMVRHFASEIQSAVAQGVQVGVVIGGGNIFRGVQGSSKGFDRRQGDQMGMLATVINAMAVQAVLEEMGVKAKVLTAMAIEGVSEKISWRKAVELLESGYVVLMGGGTGNPFFTTDSGAALRAVEIRADLLLKGTRVDGVYTADPEKDPTATRYEELTFSKAISDKLKVMDMTAFALCEQGPIPIIVFNVEQDGNLTRLLNGEKIGTVVHA